MAKAERRCGRLELHPAHGARFGTPAIVPRHDPLVLIFTQYTRRVVGLMIALFCSFLSLYALVTWLPTLMGSQGFTITRSLSFTLAITTAFPISSIVLMVVLDRFGRIRTCVGSFLLAGVAAMLFAHSVGDTMLPNRSLAQIVTTFSCSLAASLLYSLA